MNKAFRSLVDGRTEVSVEPACEPPRSFSPSSTGVSWAPSLGVPQELWGEIIEELEEFEQHSEALDVGTDSDDDDDPYDPTEFAEHDDDF